MEQEKINEKANALICSKCGLEINAGKEVYCPDCGAPLHRECWQENGCCPFADKHGDGFVWQDPKITVQAYDESQEGETEAYGYTEEKPMSEFDRAAEVNPDAKELKEYIAELKKSYGISDDRAESVEKEYTEKIFGGVSYREMGAFINASTPRDAYRIALYQIMALDHKLVWPNFFAGLFAPYYQFYKGMYPLGMLAMGINLVASLPQIVAYYFYFTNPEKLEGFLGSVMSAVSVLGFLQIAMMILLSLFGSYLYFQHMVKKIKKIRAKTDNEWSNEYLQKLAAAGKPKPLRVVLCFGIQMLLVALVIFVLVQLGY